MSPKTAKVASPEAVRLGEVMMDCARRVQAEIDSILPRTGPETLQRSLKDYIERSGSRMRPSMGLYQPIRHVIEAGGKRIRPTLCMLACEAVGGDPEKALPTAAAIELIHTFTLVHDDIMDEDQLRRGRPTVAALWGNPIAIVAGDGLFSLAFGAIARNAEVEGVPPSTVLQLVKRASEVCFEVSRGQTMDLLLENEEDPTVETYLEMVRLKTGILLEYALEAGALIGGGTPKQVDTIRRFGAPLGMAFQIKDDLLNLTGTQAVLGKPRGSDIVRGKRTLMVAHALETLDRPDARRLRVILDQSEHKTTPEVVDEAIALLKKAGSLAHAEKVAEDLVMQAKAALKSLPRSEASEALQALSAMADFVIHREA